jgi:hypothetical protein
MVRHDDKGVQMNLSVIFKQTVFKDNRPRFFRQNELSASTEVYKVGRVRLLHVWQISAVKGRHYLNSLKADTNSKNQERSRPRLRFKPSDAGEGACAPRLFGDLNPTNLAT